MKRPAQPLISKQTTVSVGLLLATLALAFGVITWTAGAIDARFTRLENKLDTVNVKLAAMSAQLKLHLATADPDQLARSDTHVDPQN